MEEFEFWVGVAKKVGISLSAFQEIKKQNIEYYNKFQNYLAIAKKKIENCFLRSQEDINSIEIKLNAIEIAMKKQEVAIILFSLSKFLKLIKLQATIRQKKYKRKVFLKVCRSIIERLSKKSYSFFQDIITIGISEIKSYYEYYVHTLDYE